MYAAVLYLYIYIICGWFGGIKYKIKHVINDMQRRVQYLST